MLCTRGNSRKTSKGGPSFPANQATKSKKVQTAPGHGSCHLTWQISPSEPLENWYKDQLLDRLEELNPVKSRQLQRAKVTTIIHGIRNLGFDPGHHVLSESNTQQQQRQHAQQQPLSISRQQQQQNEHGNSHQDESDSDNESVVVEEVSGDRPRARKRVRWTEDEGDDLKARIKKDGKTLGTCWYPGCTQQSEPASNCDCVKREF